MTAATATDLLSLLEAWLGDDDRVAAAALLDVLNEEGADCPRLRAALVNVTPPPTDADDDAATPVPGADGVYRLPGGWYQLRLVTQDGTRRRSITVPFRRRAELLSFGVQMGAGAGLVPVDFVDDGGQPPSPATN